MVTPVHADPEVFLERATQSIRGAERIANSAYVLADQLVDTLDGGRNRNEYAQAFAVSAACDAVHEAAEQAEVSLAAARDLLGGKPAARYDANGATLFEIDTEGIELKPAPTEPQGLEAKLVPPAPPDGIGTRIVAAPNEAPREHWSAEMNLAYSTGFAAAQMEIGGEKGLNVEQIQARLRQEGIDAAIDHAAASSPIWRKGYDEGKYEGAKAVLRLLDISFAADEPEGIPAKVAARLKASWDAGYMDGCSQVDPVDYTALKLQHEAAIREAKFEAFQHGRQVERDESAKPDAVGAGDYDVGVQAGWDLALRRVRAGTASTNPPDMAAAISHLRECVIDEVLGGLEFDTRDLAVAPVELARRLGEADRYALGVTMGIEWAFGELDLEAKTIVDAQAEMQQAFANAKSHSYELGRRQILDALGYEGMSLGEAAEARSKRGQEILEDGKRAGQNLTLSELGFKAGDLAGAVAAVQALKDARAGIGRDDIIDEVLAALGFGGMTIEEAQICRRHEQEEANEVVQAAAQALDPEGPYAAGMKHVLTAMGWGNLELGDAVSRKSKLTIDAAFAHNKPLPSDDHSVRFRDGEAAGVRAALLRLGFTGMTLDEAAQAAQELRARDPGSDPILSQLPADRPLLNILVELGATAQLGALEGHHGRIDRANAIREAVMATEVVWRRDVAANRDMGAASNYGADKQQEVRANA